MESSLAIIAGIFGLGTTELVVILIILLVLFGGAKLPGLAKGLGQSIKEFKKATNEEEEKEKTTKDETKQVDPKDTHGNN
tara:strand:+ start:326 stop:565 length:240 start_codon:yes stop_codon:yes gene_type:complete